MSTADSNLDQFLTLREFADEAGLSVYTMRTYLTEKRLPPHAGVKGNMYLWRREDAEQWIASREDRE